MEIEVGKLAHFTELFFYYDPSGRAYHGLHFFYSCQAKTLDLLDDNQVQDSSAERPRWVAIQELKAEEFQSEGDVIVKLCKRLARAQAKRMNGMDGQCEIILAGGIRPSRLTITSAVIINGLFLLLCALAAIVGCSTPPTPNSVPPTATAVALTVTPEKSAVPSADPAATASSTFTPPPTPAYLTRLPPGKQTMEIESWARWATALAGTPGPTVPPPVVTIPSGPTPTLVIDQPHRSAGAGILIPGGSFSGGNAPGAGALYFTTDVWIGTIKGIQFGVEAGAIAHDSAGVRLPPPWQGILVVHSDDPKLGGFFLTPVKAGTVRIVDADGTQLKLLAEDGTSFTFDVSTLRFISP